jgi:serine/threonine protein kinase
VKVFDFSSSKLIEDPSIYEGKWSGNIRWQPPEVAKRKSDRTTRIEYPFKVDVYSFGMVLWVNKREKSCFCFCFFFWIELLMRIVVVIVIVIVSGAHHKGYSLQRIAGEHHHL